MNARFLKKLPQAPGKIFLLLALAALSGTKASAAENPESAQAKPLFTWDLLWTGSWQKSFKTGDDDSPPELFRGGTLFNRGDLGLGLPGPHLSFRFLATDKRILPPEENDPKAGFNPGLGAYHNPSGSRFLYGPQNEYGLPARLRNVWLRASPFMEARSPQARDLETEPSARDAAETSLYLGLPPMRNFGAFASAALDEERNPAFGGGIGLFGLGADFRLEGFFAQKELPPRKAQSWFSQTPPLPERDFRLYALALIFNSPSAAFASDWALSETFAWGRGVYGNFALRLGNKPWRFSLAGDGAEGRFADRDGSMAGTGFRFAVKGEHFRPRSGLLRVQGTFDSPARGEAFEEGSLSLYFRPPAPPAKAAAFPFRFSRASLGMSRDAKKPEKAEDALNAGFGFRLWFLNASVSGALRSLSRLDAEGGKTPLFQPKAFETFESFKFSGELGWNPGAVDLKTRLGYTIRAKKPSLWEPSLACSIKPGKWGKLGLKIASADFPKKWNYALSWRFAGRGP